MVSATGASLRGEPNSRTEHKRASPCSPERSGRSRPGPGETGRMRFKNAGRVGPIADHCRASGGGLSFQRLPVGEDAGPITWRSAMVVRSLASVRLLSPTTGCHARGVRSPSACAGERCDGPGEQARNVTRLSSPAVTDPGVLISRGGQRPLEACPVGILLPPAGPSQTRPASSPTSRWRPMLPRVQRCRKVVGQTAGCIRV